MSGISPGQVPDPGTTVLVERRVQASIVFAFLVVAFAAALFRGVTGAQTSAGRVAVVVVFGALLVVLIVGWIRWGRSPRRRLEMPAAGVSTSSAATGGGYISYRGVGPERPVRRP